MNQIVVRRFFLVKVGLDVTVPPKEDSVFSAAGPGGTLDIASRAFRDFDEAIEHLQLRSDARLVHICNEVQASPSALIEGCQKLAHAMSVHGRRPSVDLVSRHLQFLATPFIRAGVKVHENWGGVADLVRWNNIAREHVFGRYPL